MLRDITIINLSDNDKISRKSDTLFRANYKFSVINLYGMFGGV